MVELRGLPLQVLGVDDPDVTDQNAPVHLHHYDLRALTEQSAALSPGGRALRCRRRHPGRHHRRTSTTLARDRGHLTSKLAVAITRATKPDPERAAGLGLQALSIARHTGSARIMCELSTLDAPLTGRITRPTTVVLATAIREVRYMGA